MWQQKTGSLLVTGVPVERGRPIHIEHDDGFARTDFDTKTGQVAVIHTPDSTFCRVHEIMHARHSDPKRMQRQYKYVNDGVWNVVEDCRIHLSHWPWPKGKTPPLIQDETQAFLDKDMGDCTKALAEDPKKRGTWADFATRMRQAAIKIGMGRDFYRAVEEAGFVDGNQQELASEMLNRIHANREGSVARQLEKVFFPPPPPLEGGGYSTSGKDGSGRKVIAANSARERGPQMEIIELPHTERIPEAKIGYRRARSGHRMIRSLLRKPILPQRLFLRRTPRDAAGTILVDASGSMGDWDEIKKWCEKAPFGTIAYYSGNGRNGWLYVYARNGKRAAKIVKPKGRGNTVDGPAMDWLLTQPKPRRMITDRGFCDVPDSLAQVARLGVLERAGEIEVLDYAHNDE